MKKSLVFSGLVGAVWLLSGVAQAVDSAGAVPDLTQGGQKTGNHTWNLEPTGVRGWIFNPGSDTSKARQILVTEVEKASPADRALAPDEVILGIKEKPFETEARRAFIGEAITEAEENANKRRQILATSDSSLTQSQYHENHNPTP